MGGTFTIVGGVPAKVLRMRFTPEQIIGRLRHADVLGPAVSPAVGGRGHAPGERLERSVRELASEMPGSLCLPCDVTKADQVEEVFRVLKQEFGGLDAISGPHHGRPCHVEVTLPPLGAVLFKSTRPR